MLMRDRPFQILLGVALGLWLWLYVGLLALVR